MSEILENQDAKTLYELLNKYKVLKVPEYQRDYSWKTENLEDLWTDVETSFEDEDTYFMGTIVLMKEQGNDAVLVVDGQQRMVTFSILLCVLRMALHSKQKSVLPEEQGIQQKIWETLGLFSTVLNEGSESKPKLTLNKKDNHRYARQIHGKSLDAFDSSLEWNKSIPNDPLLIKTWKFFLRKILNKEWFHHDNPLRLTLLSKHILERLIFLPIIVADDANAYMVFESLNSKGLDLTEADLLKNKLLMITNDHPTEKEKIFETWDAMITEITSSRFTPVGYLRCYWLAFRTPTTKKKLYRTIRDHLSISLDENADLVLREVLDWSERVDKFCSWTGKEVTYPSPAENDMERHLQQLNTLKYDMCYPTFMYADRHFESYLPELIESTLVFLFRNITICRKSVKEAEELFSKINEVLKDCEKYSRDIDKQETRRIFEEATTDDSEFEKALAQRKFNSELGKYVHCRLHEFSSGTALTLNSKQIHLEHILPKKATNDGWGEYLNSHQDTWEDDLHRIGNLTILESKDNIVASNKGFEEKKRYYQEYSSVTRQGINVEHTLDVGKEDKWTKQKIEDYSNKIAEKAVGIWKLDYLSD